MHLKVKERAAKSEYHKFLQSFGRNHYAKNYERLNFHDDLLFFFVCLFLRYKKGATFVPGIWKGYHFDK